VQDLPALPANEIETLNFAASVPNPLPAMVNEPGTLKAVYEGGEETTATNGEMLPILVTPEYVVISVSD